jgi:mRNA interferase HigB
VQILGRGELADFARGHATARKRLAAWEKVVQAANWNNLVELKATFGSADLVDGEVVFNIGGNNFRLRAIVDFKSQTVLVTGVQTHSEYSKQR